MWKALKYILLFFLIEIILVVFFICVGLFLRFNKSEILSGLMPALALSQIIFVWIAYLKKQFRFSTSALKKEIFGVVGISVLIVISLLVPESVWHIEILDVQNINEKFFEDVFEGGISAVCILLAFCVFGPVAEEILFRKIVLYSLLESRMLKGKAIWAILISSLLFAIFHVSPEKLLYTFIAGLLYAWVDYRTGSLWPSIILHIINNSFIGIGIVLSIWLLEETPETFSETSSITELFGSSWAVYLIVGISLVICVVLIYWLKKFLDQKYPKVCE